MPKLYDHASPYILQHTDGRIVFVIPYEHDFSLIGTTDSDYQGDPAAVAITDDETAYLCAAVEPLLQAAGHARPGAVGLCRRAAAASTTPPATSRR